MLLDFSLPQVPATSTQANNNLDINSILGLTPSKYEGLQNVRDTGYLYGNNNMYEPYTPSPVQYYYMGGFNQPVYYQPNVMTGMGVPSTGGISNRWQTTGGAEEGTIYKGDQAFRPIDSEVQGFTRYKGVDDKYEYSPSMAYVYANNPNKYVPPAVTPNLFNLPMPDVAMNSYEGSHGAGRFLDGGVLGFDFGQGIGQEASE